MRNFLFIALALTTACKWTDFDDLENTTWVRSTQAPDLGASDYAIAIAGVTTGPTGGTLAVLSKDNANFSTLTYDAKGKDALGANPVDLGKENIGALADVPVFATDATGHIGLVDRSIVAGNYAVVFGTATAPTALDFMAMSPTAPSPDAAVFLPNGDFMFAAGNTLYMVSSAGAKTNCLVTTDNIPMSMGLQVAAMDVDATNNKLWVWTKAGSLISYPLTDPDATKLTIATCSATAGGTGTLAWDGVNGDAFTPTAAIVPAAGARVHVVGGFAILTGHPTTSRSGSVFVVDLASTDPAIMSKMTVEGLTTSTIAKLGTDTYLVLGVPDRSVEGVAAGAVDLITYNPSTGTLAATPSLSLHDAQPESGQLFGRAVTTMSFNGSPILVVSGDSEVYAYYRTALYDNLP